MHNIAITPTPDQTRGERYRCSGNARYGPALPRAPPRGSATKSIAVETADLIPLGGRQNPSRRHGEHIGVFPGFLSTTGDAQKRSTSWASPVVLKNPGNTPI